MENSNPSIKLNPTLKNNLKFEDFEVISQISKGAFGDVFLAKNFASEDKFYAIKTIPLRPKESDEDILKEIDILEKFNENQMKPQSIPQYFGFYKESNKFQQTQYHLIFEYFPLTLKSLINDLKEKSTLLSFKKIRRYFNSLINALAYLQAMNVCHRDLKPENLLLDENLENIYIIDYGFSNHINSQESASVVSKKVMDIAGSPMYFSPELMESFTNNKETTEINPFKSDVFSFGIIFLELATLKLPKKHNKKKKWSQKGIEQSIENFKMSYIENISKEKERKQLKKILKTLKKCLEFNPDLRPDFLDIFAKKIKKITNNEKLKLHILVEDNQIILNKNDHEKKNLSSGIQT